LKFRAAIHELAAIKAQEIRSATCLAGSTLSSLPASKPVRFD
jgi:hypothetical protein